MQIEFVIGLRAVVRPFGLIPGPTTERDRRQKLPILNSMNHCVTKLYAHFSTNPSITEAPIVDQLAINQPHPGGAQSKRLGGLHVAQRCFLCALCHPLHVLYILYIVSSSRRPTPVHYSRLGLSGRCESTICGPEC